MTDTPVENKAAFTVFRPSTRREGFHGSADTICTDGTARKAEQTFDPRIIYEAVARLDQAAIDKLVYGVIDAAEAQCAKPAEPAAQSTPLAMPENLSYALVRKQSDVMVFDSENKQLKPIRTMYGVQGICAGATEPFNGEFEAPYGVSEEALMNLHVAPTFCGPAGSKAIGRE